MSLHLRARHGEIASTVLITGDPLRAKYYSENFLENPVCYNQIRGMLGYTGTHQGKKISIQGTGIGIPSTALYVHELIHGYGVNCIMRIGTCGGLQADLQIGDVVVATEALTDSAAVQKFSKNIPKPSPQLLMTAESSAQQLGIAIRKGPVFSTDLFYSEDNQRFSQSIQQGVLGVDMETSMVYAMGAYFNVQSLSLLTVSDNLITGKEASAEQRERQADDMIRLALEVVSLRGE